LVLPIFCGWRKANRQPFFPFPQGLNGKGMTFVPYFPYIVLGALISSA